MQIEGSLQRCFFSNIPHLVAPTSALALIGKPIPSNDILSKCFVVEFLLNRESYNLHVSSIAIKKYISIDHTFKVASNIGYVRSDGKWITLYNSLFIVMNEHGQVVSWQFTRITSLDDVAAQLHSVKNLRSLSWLPPYTILVDNCCSQRPKLMQIFGDTAVVKLDIFHAAQRITRKLPKRHPFYTACICDLKLVFRSPTDIGGQQTQNTPSPNTVLEQLDNFLKKWQSCEWNGWRIITDSALKEISSLKVHVQKGCLSDISPGTGTNRNEALHKQLNTYFANRSRIGLPFALSLLTIIFFQHNCYVDEKLTGKRVQNISSWKRQNYTASTVSQMKFGIYPKDIQEHPQVSWISRNLTDVAALNSSTLQQAIESAMFSHNVLELVSVAHILNIIETSINLYKTAIAMQKQSSYSPTYNYKMIPLMSSVASLFFNPKPAEHDHCSVVDRRLNDLLKAWGMERHYIDGDGNCCFSAVAYGLFRHFTMICQQCPHFFSSIGLRIDGNDVKTVSEHLRQLTIQEWRSNPQDYEGFVPGMDVQQEAMKFSESGYFFGDLADTIVLALSNLLGLPLIIFTSNIHQPVISITPRHVRAAAPLFLVFNQAGAGHYDAVEFCDSTQALSLPVSSVNEGNIKACSCGKNDKKTTTTHCHPITTKYTTRTQCICCRKERACTTLCCCKSCNNPFGQKPPKDDKKTTEKATSS